MVRLLLTFYCCTLYAFMCVMYLLIILFFFFLGLVCFSFYPLFVAPPSPPSKKTQNFYFFFFFLVFRGWMGENFPFFLEGDSLYQLLQKNSFKGFVTPSPSPPTTSPPTQQHPLTFKEKRHGKRKASVFPPVFSFHRSRETETGRGIGGERRKALHEKGGSRVKLFD